jgi:hypothetical protein
MLIPDPNFSILVPGSKKIPDPGSGFVSNNSSIFNPKFFSKLSEYDPGFRDQKGTGPRIRIRTTAN